ncbi:MAG: hypothetical protein IJU57_06815 [Clostridia bacterium]|nr:hypothetical protein [Clostridia bacterium]
MKKITAAVAFILAVMMLLSSCNEAVPGPEPKDDPGTEPQSAAPVESDEPPESAEQPEEGIPEEDFYEDRGSVKVLRGLDFIPDSLTNSYEGCVVAFKDEITSIELGYIDFEKRTIRRGKAELGEVDMGGLRFSNVWLINGFVVIMTDDTREIIVLDRELKEIYRGAFEEVSGQMVYAGSGRIVSMFAESEGLLIITVGADGQPEISRCDIEYPGQNDSIYVNSYISGDEMLVDFYGSETYEQQSGILNISTGECRTFSPDLYGFMSCSGCILSTDYMTGEIRVFDASRPNLVTVLDTGDCRINDGWYPSWPKGEASYLSLVRTDLDNTGISVVDPVTGERAARIGLDPDIISVYPVVEIGERICALLRYDYEGAEAEIMIAGLEKEESPNDWPGMLTREDPKGKRANDARAEEMYREYGISVYMRDESVRYLNGYAVVPAYDEAKIAETLDIISGFFKNCPEGFVRDIAAQYSGFDICLVNRIIPDTSNRNSIGDAAAFTVETGGIELIVIDVTSNDLDRTIAHEFFHVIENTMTNLSVYDPAYYGIEAFARWELLNPYGFEYRWIYTEEDGSTVDSSSEYLSTYWTEGREDEIYFVDGYCTTYPSEDRARVFEYIAVPPDGTLPVWFGEKMILKAEYLCACIREVFGDENWEDVSWERFLDPGHDLQYFRENYQLWPAW